MKPKINFESWQYKAKNAIQCPFCASYSISVKHKEIRFNGVNGIGDKKIRMKAYCICNKCKATGTPIFYTGHTMPGIYGFNEEHLPIYCRGDEAIKAWNKRTFADWNKQKE